MNKTTHHPRTSPSRGGTTASSRRGLSIVEVMISLTISSFLLVAVAAAYNASASAVEMNDRFFRATQAGRVTMNQLLTEIRRADSVVCADTYDSIIVTRPEINQLPEEESREYRYDAAAKKITLQIYYKTPPPGNTAYKGPLYALASNVEAATFGPADQIKDATGHDVDVRIPITLEVKIGGNQVRLSGSSAPRRLLQN